MDKIIIQRCKDGDLHAFEELYAKYSRKLYGLCLRMSGNQNDAEDYMQEIFIVLLKKIKAFRGESKFSTWLYRVAVNTCISQLRKRKGIMVAPESALDRKPAQLNVTPQVIHRTTLTRAIAQLPDGYRSAVILHDIQGFHHHEIGQILGISVGSSKSQLFKARRKLREILGHPNQYLQGARTARAGV